MVLKAPLQSMPGLCVRPSSMVFTHQALPALPLRAFASGPPDLELEKRRKRLTWRAKSRGWLELDVLMGTFVEKHVSDFNDQKLDLLEEVLELENPDLFKWFTKQAPVPDELLKENEVMKLMMDYVSADHKGEFNIK